MMLLLVWVLIVVLKMLLVVMLLLLVLVLKEFFFVMVVRRRVIDHVIFSVHVRVVDFRVVVLQEFSCRERNPRAFTAGRAGAGEDL